MRRLRFGWLGLLALAAAFGTGARSAPVDAAEPIDNDELVADPEFMGLPDKDSHSGVFLDQLVFGSNSLIQPGEYDIRVPAATTTLRVAIFDGNNGGLWDQNGKTGPIPDSVTQFDLRAATRTGNQVALGESEATVPTPGAVSFANAVDSRWQFLYQGAQDPSALVPGGLEYRYRLIVRYRDAGSLTFPAINGFKIAVNGTVLLTPETEGEVIVGGFIGGVVDSTNTNSISVPGISRDHYPQSLKSFQPLLPWGGAADPFVNNYVGTIPVPIHLRPRPGQTWADYVNGLVIEEGDTDDASDETGTGPDGLPSVVVPGIPPDDPLPPSAENGGNDGGYTIPRGADINDPNTSLRNNLHYKMLGRPRYVVVDPDGIEQGSREDLSGNVAETDPTGNGFERIQIPAGVDKPGVWTIRFENVDARNTIFVRTNAAPPPPVACLSGKILCHRDCDPQGGGDGISGVTVRVRTSPGGQDVVPQPPPTDANGAWSICDLAPGDYEVFVDPAQPALAGKPRLTPDSDAVIVSVVPGENTAPHYGYCCEEKCVCGPDGLVHRIALVTRVWVGCNRDIRLTITQRKGCYDCSPIVDRAFAQWSGDSLPSGVRGTTGILEIVAAGVQDGELVVYFVSTAQAPVYLDGAFRGRQRFDVTVNCRTVSACDYVKCDCLRVNEGWPCGACPPVADPCCDCCRPKFVVADYVPWACEKPCTDGCTRTIGYWKNHNKYARVSGNRIPWPTADGEDTVLCGKTWLEILRSPSNGEAWIILAKQYIGAKLNCYAGACKPDVVRAAMDRATRILEGNCPPLPRELRETAIATALILDQYNNGKLGPKHCD